MIPATPLTTQQNPSSRQETEFPGGTPSQRLHQPATALARNPAGMSWAHQFDERQWLNEAVHALGLVHQCLVY